MVILPLHMNYLWRAKSQYSVTRISQFMLFKCKHNIRSFQTNIQTSKEILVQAYVYINSIQITSTNLFSCNKTLLLFTFRQVCYNM